MTDCILVYVTAAEPEEAKTIGRTLVDEKLAACANIFAGMQSIYSWNGSVEEGRETVLILKTRAVLFDALAAQVKSMHSFSNPCIVAFPITQGAPSYLNWIRSATAESVSSIES